MKIIHDFKKHRSNNCNSKFKINFIKTNFNDIIKIDNSNIYI